MITGERNKKSGAEREEHRKKSKVELKEMIKLISKEQSE